MRIEKKHVLFLIWQFLFLCFTRIEQKMATTHNKLIIDLICYGLTIKHSLSIVFLFDTIQTDGTESNPFESD